MEEQKYIVVEESISAHCCFEYSIVEVAAFKTEKYPEPICECFTKEGADKICHALNMLDS